MKDFFSKYEDSKAFRSFYENPNLYLNVFVSLTFSWRSRDRDLLHERVKIALWMIDATS